MTGDSLALMGVKGGPAIRPGSNMPTAMLLRLGGRTVLIDAGLGATRGICDQGVPLTGLDLILITHLHSDHYLELGPYFHTAWLAGLNRSVPVIGPSGLADYWSGFLASMRFDIELRIADEGRCPLAPLAALQTLAEGTVFDDGTLTVRALANRHPPITDSFALRLEAGGKAVVLSGDTAYMDEMADFARGADLLVHEAMLPEAIDALCARLTTGDARLKAHILRSHTSAEDTGRIARAAGVGRLALNHFVPDGDPAFAPADWEAAVRQHWAGPLSIGTDGMVIRF